MPEILVQQAIRIALQHHQAGQLPEAEKIYRQIIAQRPDEAAALHLLGAAAGQQGRLDEAADLFRRAIIICSEEPTYFYNLGKVCTDLGRLDEAITAYRKAVALKPDYAEAHQYLGNALSTTGHLDEAIVSFREGLRLQPENIAAGNSLAMALQMHGQFDEAISCYREILRRQPSCGQGHVNLGTALAIKGRFDEAIASLREGIRLKPECAEAYSNLANVLKDSGQLDEAIVCCREALRLRPDFVTAHGNLAYALHFHPDYDIRAIYEEHVRWNRLHAAPLKKLIKPYINNRNSERRLRIGYVSPDLREHVVGGFMLPLLAAHDHREFEVFCYANVAVADAMTERLRGHADQWRSIFGMGDEQVAELIRKDGIDILIDLAMHMNGNRLLVFARKPAPVQVTYLAYCSTTGLGTMNYRFTDPYLDPEETEAYCYAEESVRLPETYWCYEQPGGTPETNEPPALKHGSVAFGCLNNFCKVSDKALGTWGKLLRALPNSRLILHAHAGSHRERVRRILTAMDVAPERCEFADFAPRSAYFREYQKIDIGLDPFPYAGGTTTCDALWMGVPVVTLAGRTAVGRGGVSILSNLGLGELVAHSEEEYVQIATRLATDLPRLAQLRGSLRQRMKSSPLMDAPQFAQRGGGLSRDVAEVVPGGGGIRGHFAVRQRAIRIVLTET